jgi:hypothetical protein
MADVEHDLARRLRGGFALNHDSDRIRTPGMRMRAREPSCLCSFHVQPEIARLRCTSDFPDLAEVAIHERLS